MVKSLYLNGEIFTPSLKLFSINLVYNTNYFIFKQLKFSLMKTNEFTPEESFALIDQVIQRAKNRFEENGFAFILWGALTAFCCFSQAYLIHIGLGVQSWYPYLLMPLASIFTIVYYSKKDSRSSNPLNVISSRLWMFTGFNIMILAFGFSAELRSILSTIILLLLGIATAVAGSFIRSKMLLFCGILLNLGAYAAFFIPWKQHSILMGVVALVAFLLPGLLLHYKHKKKDA